MLAIVRLRGAGVITLPRGTGEIVSLDDRFALALSTESPAFATDSPALDLTLASGVVVVRFERPGAVGPRITRRAPYRAGGILQPCHPVLLLCTVRCVHITEGSIRMPITTLDELFEHNLKDIYGAEQRLLESLDEMAGEATDREAKKAFQQHKKETQGQIKRLEKVFKTLGMKAEAQPCPGMEGLIKEKKSFSKEKPSEDILGFYNLHAAQKVERYEITSYEGLIEAAQHMGMDEAVDLLQQNLDEEERTLDLLKRLASDYEVEQEEGEEARRRRTRRNSAGGDRGRKR